MSKTILKNCKIVNEGTITEGDVLIRNGRFERIADSISIQANEIDVKGNYLFPGIIDDQVHFREPGLTHKADISSESRAAVQGGCTSFMEMPNTKPPTITHEELQKKYNTAGQNSPANFSFYFGATNDNFELLKEIDPRWVCGVKIFMGSSTGNMLVDNDIALENIFRESPCLIATHCEDESRIRHRTQLAKELHGTEVGAWIHPIVRDRVACQISSQKAIGLAEQFGSRLHILHISTAEEVKLFNNNLDRKKKQITSEVCVHHLYYNDLDYSTKGNLIKCNPAIKSESDRLALHRGLQEGYLDIVATDHAPHTLNEKSSGYWDAPSGLPLVAHAFNIMISFYHDGLYSLPSIADKLSHAPADIFQVKQRGYIREGYWADCFVADVNANWTLTREGVPYKCAWSPLEGESLRGKVLNTFVNGNEVFNANSGLTGVNSGMRLEFDR